MKFIKCIVAIFTWRELVWLRHFDGELELSIAVETPFGYELARLSWPFGHTQAVLLPNGEVRHTYVEEWKPANIPWVTKIQSWLYKY